MGKFINPFTDVGFKKKGRAEGHIEDARKMKELGATIEFISQVTGLTAEEIEAL